MNTRTASGQAPAARRSVESGADAVFLVELYVEQRLPSREIGRRLGISKQTVLKRLRLAGIEPRPRALKGVPRSPEVRAKISESKMGHPVSPDTRAKLSRAHRRRDPERRSCLWCGKNIRWRRVGLEDVSAAIVNQFGLDLVPGWVIASGGGWFCSDDHADLWWKGKAKRPGPGPSEFPCDICSRPLERWPSQVSNAKKAGYRFVCGSCDGPYRRFQLAAARACDDAKPRAPFSEASLRAFERVWLIACAFEAEIVASWPRTGRRPPLAVDLVILSLYRRGFTDKSIWTLLNEALQTGKRIPGVTGPLFNAEYVTKRRRRSRIRRAA